MLVNFPGIGRTDPPSPLRVTYMSVEVGGSTPLQLVLKFRPGRCGKPPLRQKIGCSEASLERYGTRWFPRLRADCAGVLTLSETVETAGRSVSPSRFQTCNGERYPYSLGISPFRYHLAHVF